MTLTKADIINHLNDQSGLSKNRSANFLDSMLEIIKKTLESKEDVLISGLGKFSIKEKNERRGRNPANGNNLTLEARKIVRFKCSEVLKDKINKNS